MRLKRIYRPDTPFYAKNRCYWPMVIGVTLIDTATLYALFDILIGSNKYTTIISTVSITAVLDVYSISLPSAVSNMSKTKKYTIFGLGLAIMIGVIYCVYLSLRLTTYNAASTDGVYVMSSGSSVIFNLLLGLVPLASTICTFYLSIQKDRWDHLNDLNTIDFMLNRLQSKRAELTASNEDIVRLREVDRMAYDCAVEKLKAIAQLIKIESRLEFAKSIGDETSISSLTEEQRRILSKKVLDGLESDELYPEPKASSVFEK